MSSGTSISLLFGEYCSGDVFDHDRQMAALAEQLRPPTPEEHDTQGQASSPADDIPQMARNTKTVVSPERETQNMQIIDLALGPDDSVESNGFVQPPTHHLRKRDFEQYNNSQDMDDLDNGQEEHLRDLQDSQASSISNQALEIRRHAFHAMIENARNAGWQPLSLLSTTDNHSHDEVELGES